jgi:hypothetical protein
MGRGPATVDVRATRKCSVPFVYPQANTLSVAPEDGDQPHGRRLRPSRNAEVSPAATASKASTLHCAIRSR